MFEVTRLKLTAWYLLIIMTISLLFSFAIFSMVNVEFHRFERLRVFVDDDRSFAPPPQPISARRQKINPTLIQESRNRIIATLAFTNFAILFAAGGLGYFLAGRTLRPIKKMVDEQNRFISDSSHELRTPLTSLRSEIEVALRNKSLTNIQSKKILNSNLEEVLRLQTLSNNLLELAQNGEFINSKNFSQVSLSEVLESAIKRVAPMAKNKSIKIEYIKGKKNIKIKGIKERLIEVFVILLDNSIKYSPQDTKVEINVVLKNKNVKVLVKDHGNGISETDLPHVFERFYRADKSRKETGYGLGLSIAKKITELHNGEIEVKSEINKGTVFTTTLPA